MDLDQSAGGKKVFHAVALFDSDMEGKRGFAALTGQHLNYRKWRDVFLLQRVLPRTSRDPSEVETLVEKANTPWKELDCEIEDLVSGDLIKDFIAEHPASVGRPFVERDNGIHCFFKKHAKPQFLRFVEENAILRDVEQLVEYLKSLRFFVNLPVDGDPVT